MSIGQHGGGSGLLYNFGQEANHYQPVLNADPFNIDYPIVPKKIMMEYLKGNEGNLKEFSETYLKIRDQKFAAYLELKNKGFVPRKSTTTDVTVVVGNSGSGKSYLIDRLNSQSSEKFRSVLCSADDLLMEIPSFRHACESALTNAGTHSESHGFVRSELAAITRKYRPIAQFMVAELVKEGLRNNIPLMVEITGKAPGAAQFIENIEKAGGSVKGYICMTPAEVAAQACDRRWNSYQPISISSDQVVREHGEILMNLPEIASKFDKKLHIMARYELDSPLETVAIRGHDYYQVDPSKIDQYNETFAPNDALSITALMGNRNEDHPIVTPGFVI